MMAREVTFNSKKRSSNMVRISVSSALFSILNIIVAFGYRTIFISILTKEYLGIEGLFTNVLQVLSLAELGMGTIIAYRLYEPIKNSNINHVSKLMYFYKSVYHVIAICVLGLGLIILPLLKILIKDSNEIPTDVNIYVVYILFLIQSVSSYFFTYKQTLLVADQRGDQISLFNFTKGLAKLGIQILVLLKTKNYTLTLFSGIVVNILINYFFSIYITNLYRIIFDSKESIDTDEKKAIYKEMRAMLVHRLGGTVKCSTDNIILSAFVGLGQLGIYANYSMITDNMIKIVNQLMGNFTASIGNAYISMKKKEFYIFFKRLLAINFIIANITTVSLYALINSFVKCWQGEDMVFQMDVVVIIILCYFTTVSRIILQSFTNACGLFKKDVTRPLYEVIINLSISIYFTIKIGIIGVFLGTFLSYLFTVCWREPYLLYKYVFKNSVRDYWKKYIINFAYIVMQCWAISKFIDLNLNNLGMWIIYALIISIIILLVNLSFYAKDVVWFIKHVCKNNKK